MSARLFFASSRSCQARPLALSAAVPVRHVTPRTRAQYKLTDAQLVAFGTKRHLQQRLAQLGLSSIGARAELRARLQQFITSTGGATATNASSSNSAASMSTTGASQS